ncbi:MAG: twin-arginine translocase TatA/TatE family subunit [Roseibium sp.]|nr:twin-arginine translocase TatA/TatE family subunit [Roseibium sp.]
MGISVWQILIIAVIVVLLFGRGKISELMGDVAKGIKSFKKGMAEDDTAAASGAQEPAKTIDHQPSETVAADKAEDKSKAS